MKLLDMSYYYESSRELLLDFCSKNEASWYLFPLITVGTSCDSVLEYGTWQGQAVAAFMVAGVKNITTVDVDQTRINDYTFRDLAKKENVDLRILTGNSLDDTVHYPCPDLVFLDTVHTYEHVKRELDWRGRCAARYVAVHDTNYPPDRKSPRKRVRDAVNEFMEENPGWEVHTEIRDKTGLMIIEKCTTDS